MNIHLIWAQNEKGGIGHNGKLPWHIPEDLKNFKKLTLNHPVVMGRLTWESLPFKPLPNRRNIIMTTKGIQDQECYPDQQSCLQQLERDNIPDVFIIGGASIYRLFYPVATDLHMTIVLADDHEITTNFPISLSDIKSLWYTAHTMNLTDCARYYHWLRISH